MKKTLALMSALTVLLTMTACEKKADDSSEKATSSSIAEVSESKIKSDNLIEKKIDNFCFSVPKDAEEEKSYSETDNNSAYYYYYTDWGMIFITYTKSDEIIPWHSDTIISEFYNGWGETIEIVSDEKIYIGTETALKYQAVSHSDGDTYLSAVCANTLNGNIVFSVVSYDSTENAEYHYNNLKDYFKFDSTADSVDIPQSTITKEATTTSKPTTTSTTTKRTTTTKATTTRSTIDLGLSNAVQKAKSYLNFSSFSYLGLIEQLEYEQFTHDEAVYGANNCGADWYEQSLKKAQEYLEYSSFSYSGLIEQLEYEKFTHEEAVYGADNCGADWFEQAALKAQEYLDYTAFSRQDLIDQLIYEKFTQEQAEYGAQAVGY